jgi:hypothetical protein
MNIKAILTAAGLALSAAAPATAAPIALDFEFGGVSGTLYGLDDAVAGPQQVTSYDFFGVFDTYSDVSSSSGSILSNEVVFQGGVIFSVSFDHLPFFQFGDANFGVLDEIDLDYSAGQSSIGYAREFDTAIGLASDVAAPVIWSQRQISAVPLPAGGLLLLTGLARLAAAHRRKKRTAQV